jgi:hypothetical protein
MRLPMARARFPSPPLGRNGLYRRGTAHAIFSNREGRLLEKCKLCERETRVVQSHIIPAFAMRWLKDTSGTGRLRQAINPNVPRQDMTRVRLLCKDCEGRFSGWETNFAERIFLPARGGGAFAFRYGEWLLRFAVSIAWRVAAVEIELLRSVKPSLADKVGAALGIWRSYLLSERHDAGAYEHHIFILDYITGATGRTLIPPKTHFYLLRGVDATLVYSSGIVYVYAKLPGSHFLIRDRTTKDRGNERNAGASKGSPSLSAETGIPGLRRVPC